MMQQETGEIRNLILVVVLATLILFVWHLFYEGPRQRELMELQQQQQQQQAAQTPDVVGEAMETLNGLPAPEVEVIRSRKEVLAETREQGGRAYILSETLQGSINLTGAKFDDLSLLQYKKTLEPDSENVVLLSPTGTRKSYFTEFGWAAQDPSVAVPGRDTVWSKSGGVLKPGQPISLFWDNGQGVRFILDVSVDEDYLFTVKQRVENETDKAIRLYPYGRINRGWEQDHRQMFILHEGAIGVVNETLEETTFQEMAEDGTQLFEKTQGWIGFSDKYWQTVLIPDRNYSMDAKFSHYLQNNQNARYQVDYLTHATAVEAYQQSEVTHLFYAGAKKLDVIDKYAAKYNLPLFDRSIDFGVLYFITKPIFKMLRFFHGFVGNFGIAILLLTVVIKAFLYPLANKSFTSMAQMRNLQPEIKALKDRYGNDRMQLNQKMMELYKKEKVNPVSGCLPLLIQIPIFFALYKVLFVTIEMRHAPFFGWIKDLSATDPSNVFNLFGLLPWELEILQLGALPIMFAATMYLQQQLSPKPADPMQEKVMKLLPLIFLFVFATFPAGLVIYWTWNNLLSILQQWSINKHMERKGIKTPSRKKTKKKTTK